VLWHGCLPVTSTPDQEQRFLSTAETTVRVLVIDDSNTIRRSAEIFLKQGGHDVMLAEDGFDALAKVNDYQPQLIFCDILMPRLDGYQTCAIIKRNAKYSSVPVVMLFDKTLYQRSIVAGCAAIRDSCARSEVMAIHKVLIVDDSKTEIMFLTDLLRKNGFVVRSAENADEAFKRLTEEKPDLILMDVVMPGQNGFQLTRSINRTPEYTHIPIFICTSKSLETDRVWGMRQGAKDYITKPVDAAELFAKIKALG
jgi:twitching motility two-component system response regulator PilH